MGDKTYPPNPLPCGCAVMGIEEINCEGTRVEYRDLHARLCSLHRAAPELLEALKQAVEVLRAAINDQELNQGRLLKRTKNTLDIAVGSADAAIAKAEGKQ